MYRIVFKNISLYFKTFGQRVKPPVVLIHGYLESMDIYEDLAQSLQKKYYVIVPDLPGHGVSGVYSSKHSMDNMAEAVKNIIDYLGIEKVHLFGHSMGGYVALAFREHYPEKLFSLCLLHSHCFADSAEKKLNREKEVEMIMVGKQELIVKTNIPRVFASDNLEKFKKEVERSVSIAMKTPEKGVVALLNGMKERPDRSHLLKEGGIPSFLVAGMKDNLIPFDVNEKMMSFAKNMKCFNLQNSGHMGFVEEKGKVLKIMKEIVNQVGIS